MTQIRKATWADAQVCWDIRNLAILNQCTSYYPEYELSIWTRGALTTQFSQVVAEHFYVAESKNEILATGFVDFSKNQVEALFVHPKAMGMGLGKQMLIYLEQLALDKAIKRLTLESTLNAATFYRSQGYVGDEKTVYHSPRGIQLDCVKMTKKINAKH
ncbi:MAG: GNAT family N-acetyltransferase [Shewanella sp.]|nr:GNAT family N-acetyltransferase [Shewanella sp.]